MLVLRNLHNYLTQILSPPSIHTALLLTPEGALVSYATGKENEVGSVTRSRMTPTIATAELAGDGSPPKSAELEKGTKGVSVASEIRPQSPNGTVSQPIVQSSPHCQGPGGPANAQIRSKDEIRIVAGLSAEVWAETRGTEGEEGTVEGEVGVDLRVPFDVETNFLGLLFGNCAN